MNNGLHKKYQEVFENHWWFLVREGILADILKKYVGTGARILDFGCNYGHTVSVLKSYGYDAFGADVSREAIEYGISKGIPNLCVIGDGQYIEKCTPESFDVILALDVVEHIEDDREAIAQMHTLLKPGGILIVMVPAYMFLWGIQDEVAEHYRRYTMSNFMSMVHVSAQKHNTRPFTILRKTYFNTLLFAPIACIRLVSRIFGSGGRQSDFDIHGPRMNKILFWIFNLERKLLRYVNFPFGVSILTVLEK
jgi:2-polyprenyl-3-methyl-5-hydroxy-6-metoxy-1,4-benzoquinol methylase